ncbi:Hpt domain-containing protein [Thioalkalicoccus limnaeus]|uniref:Hpt domain-containing protein n=1 Tax=Thioalkalicoccus limnaeus TaxID=120681 RepID=A0ABV4BGP3_9GAMM
MMGWHREEAPDDQVRDEAAAQAAAGGDAALAADLLAALVVALPDDLARIRRAVDMGMETEVVEMAHRLRGATRYCGVPALDRALAALEQAAGSGADLRVDMARVDEAARGLMQLVQDLPERG